MIKTKDGKVTDKDFKEFSRKIITEPGNSKKTDGQIIDLIIKRAGITDRMQELLAIGLIFNVLVAIDEAKR